MSRGHGARQRRVVDLLCADEEAMGEGLPLAALRDALGPDRSNARRVIGSLIDRGDAEWIHDDPEGAPGEEGERRLRLTFRGRVRAVWRRAPEYDPAEKFGTPEGAPQTYLLEDGTEVGEEEFLRRLRAEASPGASLDGAVAVVRAEREEARRVRRELEAAWEEPGRPASRRRPPGPNQLRVIAVLVRYAEDARLGLPRGAVVRIARGPEKANTLRAVRALVRSGTLQRSKDGERLRLADQATPWVWGHAPAVAVPPLDDAEAEAVLEAFGESGGVA